MVVKKYSLVLSDPRSHSGVMNSYSRYADTPIDRDLERLADELRAAASQTSTPSARSTAACPSRRTGRFSWLRRHLHLRTTAAC